MQDQAPNAKSPLPQKQVTTSINLTITQLLQLNLLLPPKLKLELSNEHSSRTVFPNQRSTYFQDPTELSLPKKRKTTEKPNDLLLGRPKSIKKCYKLIQILRNCPYYKHFYSDTSINSLMEEHIDLSLIENKLLSGEYLSSHSLIRDLRQMISQKFAQFSLNPEIYKEIFKFSQIFENHFRDCKDLPFNPTLIQELNDRVKKLEKSIKELRIPKEREKKMTKFERKKLCSSLKKLQPVYLSGVLKIVKRNTAFIGGEFEFDLEKLPNKVCRELEKYIKQCLQIKNHKEKKKMVTVIEERVDIKEQVNKSVSSVSSSFTIESDDELPGPLLEFDLWDT